MRPRTILTASLAIVAAGAVSVAAVKPAVFFGQEGMEMPKPGPQHEMLMESIGDWSGTITMHMPGMPNTPNKATEKIEAFGGFWTKSHFQCDFMGMPFEGMGTVGYDPMKGKYIGTWQDNMSPTLSVMTGDYDKESGTMTMHWEAPTMNGEIAPHRSVMTHDENSYEMKFYVGEGDAEIHNMTIKMTRAAKK